MIILLVLIAAVLIQIWRLRPHFFRKVWTVISSAARKARDEVMKRKLAWRALLLDPKGGLTPHGRVVIADLTKFCRGLTSTTIVSPITRTVDPIASAQAEGRREVLLYILKEAKLDLPQLMNLMIEEETVLAA